MQRSPISWMSAICVVAMFAGASLSAQEAARGPDGGTTYHVSGVELLAIPDKPFSAKTRTDWTRILEDGSTVKVYLEARLARDSQGRLYRERRTFVPVGSTTEPRLNEIELYDPQARTRTACTLVTHHCSITRYFPRTAFVLQPVGPFARGTRSLAREPLGLQAIEDLSVSGTRETVTINPGTMGNEQALITTREFWYSPQLGINILSTLDTPQAGKQTFTAREVSTSEPEAHFFALPEGFTVQDQRAP